MHTSLDGIRIGEGPAWKAGGPQGLVGSSPAPSATTTSTTSTTSNSTSARGATGVPWRGSELVRSPFRKRVGRKALRVRAPLPPLPGDHGRSITWRGGGMVDTPGFQPGRCGFDSRPRYENRVTPQNHILPTWCNWEHTGFSVRRPAGSTPVVGTTRSEAPGHCDVV